MTQRNDSGPPTGTQQTLETWEMRIKRLALKRKDLIAIPQETRTKGQRSALSRVSYAIKLTLDEVDE